MQPHEGKGIIITSTFLLKITQLKIVKKETITLIDNNKNNSNIKSNTALVFY